VNHSRTTLAVVHCISCWSILAVPSTVLLGTVEEPQPMASGLQQHMNTQPACDAVPSSGRCYVPYDTAPVPCCSPGAAPSTTNSPSSGLSRVANTMLMEGPSSKRRAAQTS
jgi:hypothetical protein